MKLVNIVILVSTWEFDPPSSLTMNSLNVEDMTVDTLLSLCRVRVDMIQMRWVCLLIYDDCW